MAWAASLDSWHVQSMHPWTLHAPQFVERAFRRCLRALWSLTVRLFLVTPIFAARASNLWVAVALVSLGMAAHQGWSANLYTITSDMFPRNAVGSAIGIGGTLGALGGMFVATAAGYILQITGSYYSLFVIAGSMYLIALAIIHLLAPRLEPADV